MSPSFLEEVELCELLAEKATASKSYAFQKLFENEFKTIFYKIQTDTHDGKRVPNSDRELAIYAAPGAGKTKMGSECLTTANAGVWFAHTDDLMKQAERQLKATCKDHSMPDTAVAKLKFKNDNEIETWITKQQSLPEAARVKYAIISVPGFGRDSQSKKLNKLLDFLKPDCMVMDEAHHSVGNRSTMSESEDLFMMDRISRNVLNRGSVILHLSATPVKRLNKDGKPVELDNASVIGSLGLQESIRMGLLTEISTLEDVTVPYDADDRDLLPQELADIFVDRFLSPGQKEVDLLKKMAEAQGLPESHRTIIFCPSSTSAVQYIDSMATVLEDTYDREKGVTSRPIVIAGITGSESFIRVKGEKNTNHSREAVLDMYRAGKVDVLCNYGVATEGVDLPQTTLLMINRIAKSPVLGTQILGRLLRTLTGKAESFLFDHRFELGKNRFIIGLRTKLPSLKFPSKPSFYVGGSTPTSHTPDIVSPPIVTPTNGVFDKGFAHYIGQLKHQNKAPVTEREFAELFYAALGADKKYVMACDESRFINVLISRHRKIELLPVAEQPEQLESIYGKGEIVAGILKLRGPKTAFVNRSVQKSNLVSLHKKANDIASEANGFYAKPWQPV